MWSTLVGFFVGLAVGELIVFATLWVMNGNSHAPKIARIENDDELPKSAFDFSYEICPKCGHVSLATRHPKITDTYEAPKCEKCNVCGYHAHTFYGEETKVLEKGNNWANNWWEEK